jgi:MYXO-CTERM domain-containing protein
MKKTMKLFSVAALCFFLAVGSNVAVAQDAQNTETARANDDDDDSDWGLLGLLGLIGLLGLRKKDRDDTIVDRTRNVNR